MFSLDERGAFAQAILADVMTVIGNAGYESMILPTALLKFEVGAAVAIDDRLLAPAVNDQLPTGQEDEVVAVVVADLALTTVNAFDQLIRVGRSW